MKKVMYAVVVNAPATKAFDMMLGLSDKSTYEHWTAEFNPGSTYEGAWENGSKIHFIGTDEHGNCGGMVARINEIRPNRFVSIRHEGILSGTDEILEGPEVEGWAGALENYTFEERGDQTAITVEVDVVDEHADYFNNTYPKALARLKALLEGL